MTGLRLGQTVAVRRPVEFARTSQEPATNIAHVSLDTPERLEAARNDDFTELLRLHDERKAAA